MCVPLAGFEPATLPLGQKVALSNDLQRYYFVYEDALGGNSFGGSAAYIPGVPYCRCGYEAKGEEIQRHYDKGSLAGCSQ